MSPLARTSGVFLDGPSGSGLGRFLDGVSSCVSGGVSPKSCALAERLAASRCTCLRRGNGRCVLCATLSAGASSVSSGFGPLHPCTASAERSSLAASAEEPRSHMSSVEKLLQLMAALWQTPYTCWPRKPTFSDLPGRPLTSLRTVWCTYLIRCHA